MKKSMAAIVLNQRVNDYLKLATKVREHSDEKTIHDFRVAARNILAVNKLFLDDRCPECRKEIKTWLKALNHLRDLQVMQMRFVGKNADLDQTLEHEIEKAISQWEIVRTGVAPKEFIQRMKRRQKHSIAVINQNPHQLEEVLKAQWWRLIEKITKQFQSADINHPETVHTLRVTYKSLRYLVSFLNETGRIRTVNKDELKKWQDLLGEIQDDHVAEEWLKQHSPDAVETIQSVHQHGDNLLLEFDQHQARIWRFVSGLLAAW